MTPFQALDAPLLAKPAVYFASDIHLMDSNTDIANAFCDFLKAIRPNAKALYLLGDLFEAWIGDDDDTSFNQRIIKELRQSSDAHPCYFIPGNRDILLGKCFYKKTGLQPLNDPDVVTLYQKKYLLSHGDLYCLNDINHQRFRRITQWRWLKKLVLKMPLKWRRHLASELRQQSKKHQKKISLSYMDVSPEAIISALEKHQCNAMIHGHTHQAAKHLVCHSPLKHRYVLSDWESKDIIILRIDEEGEALLKVKSST